MKIPKKHKSKGNKMKMLVKRRKKNSTWNARKTSTDMIASQIDIWEHICGFVEWN